MSYITGPRETLRRTAEAVARLYAFSISKPWPMPPDSYGPGRQPEPPEAYYQRNYVAVMEPDGSLPLRMPTDDTVRGFDGQSVLINGGILHQINLSGEVRPGGSGFARPE